MRERAWIQLESLYAHTQSAPQPELPHQPTVSSKLGLYDTPSALLWELVVSLTVSRWVSVVYSSSSEMLPYWVPPMQTRQYQPSVPLLRGRKMGILQFSWVVTLQGLGHDMCLDLSRTQ